VEIDSSSPLASFSMVMVKSGHGAKTAISDEASRLRATLSLGMIFPRLFR